MKSYSEAVSRGLRGRSRWSLMIVALAPFVLSACGGDESNPTAEGAGPSTGANVRAGGDSTEGMAATLNPRTSREIIRFGHEIAGAEAETIEAPLHGYLDAIAARRWGRACSYLSASARRRKVRFAAVAQTDQRSCAAGLRSMAKTLSPSELAALADAQTSSIRATGDRGYVIYGVKTEGAKHAASMSREAGDWKVSGSAFPPLLHSTP